MHRQTIGPFVLLVIIVLSFAVSCTRPVITQPEIKKSSEYLEMYKSGDWTVRKTAIQKLSKFNDQESIDALIVATNDSHSAVVIEALRALRRHKPAKALDRITELAEKSTHPNIRWHAIRTLGFYKDPTSAVIFAKGMNDEDWLIREESIKGLLKINDYSIRFISIPYILQALEDPSNTVKLAALKYLRIKDPRIYQKLSKILLDSQDYQQKIIEETLIALKSYELDEVTKEKVIYYLTHQNQKIRLAAYSALLSHQKSAKYRKSTITKKETMQ